MDEFEWFYVILCQIIKHFWINPHIENIENNTKNGAFYSDVCWNQWLINECLKKHAIEWRENQSSPHLHAHSAGHSAVRHWSYSYGEWTVANLELGME